MRAAPLAWSDTPPACTDALAPFRLHDPDLTQLRGQSCSGTHALSCGPFENLLGSSRRQVMCERPDQATRRLKPAGGPDNFLTVHIECT